jgi:hypothetical protein
MFMGDFYLYKEHTMIDLQKEPSKMFEIVTCVRNSLGEDTGTRRSFSTDSAYKLWEHWARYVNNTPTKKKTDRLPSAKEAENILASLYVEN